LADARASLQRYGEAKRELEIAKAEPTVQPRTEQRQPSPDEVVEAFINSRDANTQAWLRGHVDDARVLALTPTSRRSMKISAADSDAVAEGFERGTPEYFKHVETYLGMNKPADKTNGEIKVAAHSRRAPSAPVAPVGDGGGSVGGGSSNIVRLSPGEAKAAQDGTIVWGRHDLAAGRIKDAKLVGTAIGFTEMARRKLEMSRQGLYDKTWTEQ
jgi:hypothetical protein